MSVMVRGCGGSQCQLWSSAASCLRSRQLRSTASARLLRLL